MPSALVIDFHGPIAFRFSNDDGGWVWAYIPMCDYHTCNVLTDTNDFASEVHRTFELQGPTGVSKTKTKDAGGKVIGAELIQEKWTEVSGPAPGPKDCYCIFKLRLPDYLVGLRQEWVEIKKPGGGGWKDYFARGHRFYYSKCDSEPTITSVEPMKPTKLKDLHAACFHPSAGSDAKYRIEVRYHDINPLQPRPHRDADLCSASMRSLFPPFDKWKVKFKDPDEEVIAAVGPGGSDCGAHGLVLDDGGIQ